MISIIPYSKDISAKQLKYKNILTIQRVNFSCQSTHVFSRIMRQFKSGIANWAITKIYAHSPLFWLDYGFTLLVKTISTEIDSIAILPIDLINSAASFERDQFSIGTFNIELIALFKLIFKLKIFFTKRCYILTHRKQFFTERLQTLSKLNNDVCWISPSSGDINRCSCKCHYRINAFQYFHGSPYKKELSLAGTAQSNAESNARLFLRRHA